MELMGGMISVDLVWGNDKVLPLLLSLNIKPINNSIPYHACEFSFDNQKIPPQSWNIPPQPFTKQKNCIILQISSLSLKYYLKNQVSLSNNLPLTSCKIKSHYPLTSCKIKSHYPIIYPLHHVKSSLIIQ